MHMPAASDLTYDQGQVLRFGHGDPLHLHEMS